MIPDLTPIIALAYIGLATVCILMLSLLGALGYVVFCFLRAWL